ncbi:hypothetical protein Tco_1039871 [Tanacetum coccineum]
MQHLPCRHTLLPPKPNTPLVWAATENNTPCVDDDDGDDDSGSSCGDVGTMMVEMKVEEVGAWRRVGIDEYGGWIDPVMGSDFGLGRKNPPEKFSGGGVVAVAGIRRRRRWWGGGRIMGGGREYVTNSAAGGNLLERSTQDVLTIIKNKSKVRNSRNKSIVSQVKSSDVNSSSSSEIAKLTHAVNQQTSAVTTAMTAILKQFQATPPPASVKAVEEICVTCGGAHPYYQCLAADGNTFWDNIQGYVSAAAVNYNQGNSGYRPPSVANQIRPSGFAQPNVQNNQNRFSQPQGYNRGNNFNQDTSYQAPIQQNQVVPLSELEKIKKINEVNIKAMQTQINNVKNELRNEMQTSIQASMSNQTNELKNMMASFSQMNTASSSGSGSLLSNTVANPKGKLKAITTRSGIVLDGPSVPMPPPFINPEEDERAEETLTDPELVEYTIKVPPPLVQKPQAPVQKNL